MKTSKSGIEMIKKWEGLSLTSYTDSVGVWTVGYGHTKTAKPHMRITEKQAEELLIQDLKSHEVFVNRYVKVELNQNQFDALSSFVFNLGGGSLQKSTLLKKLNNKDYKGASAEFDKWVNAGGKRLQGLINRRADERKLFETPVESLNTIEGSITSLGDR